MSLLDVLGSLIARGEEIKYLSQTAFEVLRPLLLSCLQLLRELLVSSF